MLSQIFIVECELCYSLTPLKNLFYLQIHVTIDAFCYSFCNKFSPGNKKKTACVGFLPVNCIGLFILWCLWGMLMA